MSAPANAMQAATTTMSFFMVPVYRSLQDANALKLVVKPVIVIEQYGDFPVRQSPPIEWTMKLQNKAALLEKPLLA